MQAPAITICTSRSPPFLTQNDTGKARISIRIHCYTTERGSVCIVRKSFRKARVNSWRLLGTPVAQSQQNPRVRGVQNDHYSSTFYSLLVRNFAYGLRACTQ